MKYGFLKVACATPVIKVADCHYNSKQIGSMIKQCEEQKIKLVVFPELCLTGYTCGDLFLQDTLLKSAIQELDVLAKMTKNMEITVVVGLPMMKHQKLFNVAAVLHDGVILGLIPKSSIPNYSEFYEGRYFCHGDNKTELVDIAGEAIPFGTELLFVCREMPLFALAVEICEDIWTPIPPSSHHALAGATIIANCSASDETISKAEYRRELISNQSARTLAAYLYSDAGAGESTMDVVYAGHSLIAENGTLLAESQMFNQENSIIVSELDLGRLEAERRRNMTFRIENRDNYQVISFSLKNQDQEELEVTELTRFIDKAPFVPIDARKRDRRCNTILNIQACGLKKRLEHTNCKSSVIGISGGLDSTLALLVTVRAYDMLGKAREDIVAVTMPCFGTTDRTYQNAVTLTKLLGVTLREIRINEAVQLHFRDIGHDVNVHDITYENAQARERTQILMNIANQTNGMVIGTGDMSELALGWATYNGDHMSMYGVNCSVPKTLVRYLVEYYSITQKDKEVQAVLKDILDTPVSPELLPPEDGEISQKTEDIVGPYELHDFFLYYIMRFGYSPKKIYHIACYAFQGDYEETVILKWLNVFYQRFFAQQFKRSCLPDGPKVGSVALSPRGDLRMPSDASAALWLEELDKIEF